MGMTSLILMKTKGLGCVFDFNLWETEDFKILPLPTQENIEGHYCERQDYNLSSTEDFSLFLASSSLLSIVSSVIMY